MREELDLELTELLALMISLLGVMASWARPPEKAPAPTVTEVSWDEEKGVVRIVEKPLGD